MTLPLNDKNSSLLIQENQSVQIDNFQVEVISYLGQYTADIYSFKVKILPLDSPNTASKLCLMRVGSVQGGLYRELKLREALGDYKMIVELITYITAESVIVNVHPPIVEQKLSENEKYEIITNTEDITTITNSKNISLHQNTNEDNETSLVIDKDASPLSILLETDSEHLEDEYYPEIDFCSNNVGSKLILISEYPEYTKTLDTWLQSDHSLEESLYITTQVCQFFRYVYERTWCFISLETHLIKIGTPCQFFDLTNAYPVSEMLTAGLLGNYCAPELAYNKSPIHESMSIYTVGALLYHSIHKQPLLPHQTIELKINPIPRIYQILKICLSPVIEERFSLSQLLSILVETRQAIRAPKIKWNVASRSTVGLSTSRLQNEDNYGVRQQQLSDIETMILGVVADGMGGMSQGELASQLSVQTVLDEPIPAEFKTIEQRNEWLMSLFQKANDVVSKNVKNGGTTLSLVLAIAQQLMVAHVGDTRIYLLRQGEIRQLSEDHSLVAMLVASGQITEAESLEHPDRNVLTKSLGSKSKLSDGYVQDLKRTTQELSMTLENGDILLLCSDGVWDLVSKREFAEIFNNNKDLQAAVDTTIEIVIERGASDNATLLAMQCRIDK
ncbi:MULTISPECIES: PP2C family protein-serine/threonine phosphatase [unclassified Tolypothrix]|uniref:PP2C family protein-serine/threonine phosphatase n=1 Tax=unclassified Tolypothrix TaxID=2649714 RepID=UPI0005EAA63E|nr:MULTISPECIES: protein phosphatase 2C domain-containing protein [unclassified Tolypothrix]BAY95341.1 protein-serine/threonine phosphatase [Microchaete diplosiphon NIES-3275]EKE96702.1 protein phosphatase 2C [Tolypothrix sp. PCC 7601]MBE9084560.1 serine/threonine-protein phosphatase [Tolypothrix sp. LEGE 11397]UYD30560.1 serine/threonine-protein phosphatase [Tolypothrix sp. PCC 7712]UYD38309.1 serine/threonine-protein phosphatase [Tolypothrix sp. PCC 7601]